MTVKRRSTVQSDASRLAIANSYEFLTFNNIDLYEHVDRFDTFADVPLEGGQHPWFNAVCPLLRAFFCQIGVVAQIPVSAGVGSDDESNELGTAQVPHHKLEGLQRSLEGARRFDHLAGQKHAVAGPSQWKTRGDSNKAAKKPKKAAEAAC